MHALVRRLATLTGWRADLAAGLLGALSALALPSLNLVPLLLIAFPGLFVLIEAAPPGRRISWAAFRRGFYFGFGQHLVGLYWITSAILIMAADFWWFVPIAVPLLSATLALFIAVPVALARRAPVGLPRIMVLAGLWVFGEIARQYVGGGFPWSPLGSVWASTGAVGAVMTQPAAWIGTYGLSLLTVLVAGLPGLGRRGILVATLMLALWAASGTLRLRMAEPPPTGKDALLVQGDVPETMKHDRSWSAQVFRRYLEMTRAGLDAAPGRPTVVIWPETASPYLLTEDAPARQAIAAASAGAIVTLVGTVRFDAANRAFNSLVAVLPDATIGGVYDKANLVTFGEYSPHWLPFHIAPGAFEPGPGARTLHVPGLPSFAPMICYEAIFPGEVVQASDRPSLLINITNDAWFGDSTGPRQHLQAARLRAVEEGLPMLRAANTGISAGFDANGRELARLGLGSQGVLRVPIPGALVATPFAHFGLACPGVLALLSIAIGLGIGRGLLTNGKRR